MALTTNYKNKIVDSLTGRKRYLFDSTSSKVYIGLSSTDPGVVVTEPFETGNGYKRVLIGATSSSGQTDENLCKFDAASNGQASNNTEIYFPEAREKWGTLTHFCLFSSESGTTANDLIGYSVLTNEEGQPSPINVTSKDTVVLFRPHALTIKYQD